MGLKEKFKDIVVEYKKESAIKAAHKKEAREVYLEERGKQEIEYARAMAKEEAKAKLRRMQQQFKPHKPNAMNQNPIGNFLTGGFNLPMQQPVKKGKKQQKMQGYNWF